MNNKIGKFIKLSETKNTKFYQDSNEGVDIYYNSDIKEHIVKTSQNGFGKKILYAGKNKFDAESTAKRYMQRKKYALFGDKGLGL